ncbi:hypothetical protein FJ973_05915 [Mesorhizobium sp. B2-1-3]|uniref:hypothetical protein n=1 Tax=Mesorhizobium sp. B2-1-3 TaxID=2589972 RepID=UPI00112A2097|nr:hypothetical protein [Mesorhizobium sp. B2-1-3]TPN16226.1 hypothetical protein FJ973_05915 [Mesorhizobium sp. B2-1-3]
MSDLPYTTIDGVALTADRSMLIPPGSIVETGYVAVEDVVMACRDRMAVGDVDAAYRKKLQLGFSQSWPPPRGYWQDNRFIVVDGRHEYVAALMLGHSHLFVAWVRQP